MESENRCLGLSGRVSKGGLLIFDYSGPSEYLYGLSYTQRVNMASVIGELNRTAANLAFILLCCMYQITYYTMTYMNQSMVQELLHQHTFHFRK